MPYPNNDTALDLDLIGFGIVCVILGTLGSIMLSTFGKLVIDYLRCPC
jgi:hypothetical protein